MIYGYIRVSTDMQTVENQRFEISRFCEREGLSVDEWVEETVSGAKDPDKRKLGQLLERTVAGDMIISTELSRLGRSVFMLMDVLSGCMDKGVRVWTIKDNYRLGDDLQSKVLAFAFGLAAEIERDMISQRTRQALERRRAEGQVLGRPKGAVSRRVKLTGHEAEIRGMLAEGWTKADIARAYGVHRATVGRFIQNHMGR